MNYLDENDGMWDIIESHHFSKASTSATKSRAIVKLPHNILAKKNARILEKNIKNQK